jgi:hypothetical protein
VKKVLSFLAVCLCAVGIPIVSAQDAGNTPPANFIQIIREEVKPGKGAAHAKWETGYPRAFAKAKYSNNYSALVTTFGPNEAWYISRFDSFAQKDKVGMEISGNASLQADLDQLDSRDGDFLTGIRNIFARYRADLSHRPGVNIPRMHTFSITIVRIRPGHNPDFEEARKIIKAAHEKVGLKDNHSVYQVVSGLPAGTFLIITPYKTLADADSQPQMHGKEYQDAIGEDGDKKLRELAASGTISAETMYFQVDPKMSYPSKETIAADPDFWSPKPAMAAPAMKQPAAKAPAKQ